MANRIVLNNISYHGKGAIQEIVSEVKATATGTCLLQQIRICCNLA